MLHLQIHVDSNRKFEDDDEEYTDEFGNLSGDGIPDLVNANTDYADTSLDGGIASSNMVLRRHLVDRILLAKQVIKSMMVMHNLWLLPSVMLDNLEMVTLMFLQQVSLSNSLEHQDTCIRIAGGATTGVTATFVSVAENTPKANQQTVQIRSIVNNGNLPIPSET